MWFSKIFKIVTPTTVSMKFYTKQTWYKWGQREKWPRSSNKFCGWPSKIFDDLLKFRWNPSLHSPESLLLNRSILLCLFEMFFCYQTIDRVFLKTLRKSIFMDSCFFSYFHVFGEEPLNLLESLVKKLFSLGYICSYEFSYIRIILINWWKLTFLY